MTTTIVYGDTLDGYLHSFDASYSAARNGPADGVNFDTAATYGQNNSGGTYQVFQTFIRFAYPAVAAGELVTSAAVHTYQLTQLSTGVTRDLELRGFAWSGGGLELADWRSPAGLTAAGLLGRVLGVQGSQGRFTAAGSDSLRSTVQGSTSVNLVLVSSRQRAGNTPTTDEGSAIASADQAGTSSDPMLVFTTVTDHTLIPVMGAEAQLSDGSWVFLTAAAAGAVELFREEVNGTLTSLGVLSLGTGSSQWADVPAAQGLTLCVDSADNIYVVGRAGDAPNSLRHRAYIKAASDWTWTAGTIRTLGLPYHDSPINNVTCSWSPAAGGTLAVFAAHLAGDGVSGGSDSDVAYALMNSQYLLTGVGSQFRATGSAIAAGILPQDMPSSYFTGHLNETGTGLDVVQDFSQTDWGYVVSFRRAHAVGGNRPVAAGRFNLNSAANGFDFTDSGTSLVYGTKDANAKLRALALGAAGQVAVAGTDADPGYGLSIQILQSAGDVAGWTSLGWIHLGGEAIPSMPDGPALKASMAWDLVYSPAENAIWVYYVSATDNRQLMRTSIDLATYQATRVEVPVYNTGFNPIIAVRAPRNARVGQTGHVVAVTSTGYSRLRDTFNLPPLAPTLAAKGNYDATQAATFAWTFQDPHGGEDAQSAYQLQVVRVSDGVTVLDTGKVASATSSHNVAGGTLANGQDYQWRVMTWDSLDVAGPWSDYGIFTASAGGSVNITSPAADNPPGVITDDYLVSWSVTGTTQDQFRVWVVRNDTGATVHESFVVSGTQTTWTIDGLVSDVEHTINVIVWNAALVATNTATRLITPSYGAPEAPLVVLTAFPDDGYVLVTVDNPMPQGDRPDVVRNRVLRRPAGSTGPWEVLGECEPDGSFRDYTAPSRVPVEYMVRGEST